MTKKAISVTLEEDILNILKEKKEELGLSSISATIEEMIKTAQINSKKITPKDRLSMCGRLFRELLDDYKQGRITMNDTPKENKVVNTPVVNNSISNVQQELNYIRSGNIQGGQVGE